jgi:D-inositol-3-phosphate glycosyltransferase
MDAMTNGPPRARIAMLSLHTSPLDQPGMGDSGGMNVFVRAVADRLGARGIAVDVFTRCAGRGVPEVEPLGPPSYGGRVIQVQAGPCAEVAKPALPGLVPGFADSLLGRVEAEGLRYDLVHSHYWLSGAVGIAAAGRWGVPLVASFHTLGLVKDLSAGPDEDPEPPERLAGERELIARAGRILAPTPAEAAHLIELYEASPDRIRLVPPGVDRDRFRPLPAEEARRALGLGDARVALFVGRFQPIKGPETAVRALAEAIRLDPGGTEGLVLALVGGPGGPRPDALGQLQALAASLGVGHRVRFFPPRRHEDLPQVYAAADVVLVPSRSESFGLVALEAQACGVPVVASAVGGLRHLVDDGGSGFLVSPGDPAAFGRRIVEILRDPALAGRLGAGAVDRASAYPWEATAEGLISVYGELVPALAPQPVA